MVQVGRRKGSKAVEGDGDLLLSTLRAIFPMSQNEAKRLVRTGKVYVDGVPALEWNARLSVGAVVTVDTDRPRPGRVPQLREANVVHVDDSLIVVDKPSGLVTVPPTTSGEATLLDLLTALLASRRGSPVPVPVHRLDRETSGLMAFGVRGSNLEPLRSQFSRHKVLREYYAVVEGEMESCRLEGTIDVTRKRFKGKRQLKHAVTEVERVRTGNGRTLLRCRPRTGRWHQIRIQLSLAGHPICGEKEHLPEGSQRPRASRRLALQSARLSLTHPRRGRQLNFELPLESALSALLEAS